MSMIARICPRCKKQNDITAMVCSDCKTSISSIPPVQIQSEEILAETEIKEPSSTNPLKVNPETPERKGETQTRRAVTHRSPEKGYIRLRHLQSSQTLKIEVGSIFGRETKSAGSQLDSFETISRKHFIILMDNDMSMVLQDLKSLNGTTINEKPCQPDRNYPFSENDIICAGDQSFKVVEIRKS